MPKYAKYIEDISRWREDTNFMFEWKEQCHQNIKFISLSHRAILFLLFGAQLSDIADFTQFSNNRVLQQYGWAS